MSEGKAWNDITATEAVNNAKGAFPDDYYNITVTATDAAGNANCTAARVLLDNWLQTMNAVPTGLLRQYALSGSQFLPNAAVPIYAYTPFDVVAEGDTLSQHALLVGTAATDANGSFSLVVTLPPGAQFPLIADYGADDLYVPRLDAKTFLEEEDPGPIFLHGGLTGLDLDAVNFAVESDGGGGEGYSPVSAPAGGANAVGSVGARFLAPELSAMRAAIAEQAPSFVPFVPARPENSVAPEAVPAPVLASPSVTGGTVTPVEDSPDAADLIALR
ncbi:hypothetical protein [Urbifossiella limnaea]|uniref:Uncharacterized protein n=1 Tax=Urbifossiella limnaea TaxID=2528023 RepID=A0A517XYW9_9BACT|nr:hypothetical protein [Urbifossiella limnaea]QDU22717.1 hypothetical protein ETAA1_47020 [Urbifossiella limnaea]